MNLFIHSIPNWLEITFLALSTGILVSLLWVLPPNTPGNEDLRSRMWLFLTAGVFSMLATSALDLLVRSAEMSGESVTEVFPELPTVIFHTHYGSVWLIRMAVLVLLAVLSATGRRHLESRGFLLFLLALAAVVSLTESASGHAADKGDFSVVEIVDWLHLLAASAWGGGLFTLSLAILPLLLTKNDQEAFAGVASRFSRIAGLAVGVIALTAIYNAWTYVGSIPALVKSPYGWTVSVKTAVLFLLLCLGAYNRYISVPRLNKDSGLSAGNTGVIGRLLAPVLASAVGNTDGSTARRLTQIVRIESVLMVLVLLCAAVLRHEIPAKHYLHQHEEYRLHPHMHGGE